MRRKKQKAKKKNVPSKYAAQTRNEDSQSSDWSRVGVVAQVNKEKDGEKLETEMSKEMGK